MEYMDRELAMLILGIYSSPSEWYQLVDAFKERGLYSDATMVAIDGICAGHLSDARKFLESSNALP